MYNIKEETNVRCGVFYKAYKCEINYYMQYSLGMEVLISHAAVEIA